jgi:hypothetical protein
MCVIIAGDAQPDTTKLINVPIIIENNKYNFFMYINNFDLHDIKYPGKISVINEFGFNRDDKQYSRNNFNFNNRFNDSINLLNNGNSSFQSILNDGDYGNYAPFNVNNVDNNKRDNANNSVMVVPFPVNPHTPVSNIGLVDISTDDLKALRTQIKSLKPVQKFMANSYSHTDSFSASSLEVHKIGNYNISVATSYDQLLEKIDWTKFNKPRDFEERVKTFRNRVLYPPQYAYFYIVASAIENIKDDGFGIVYPQLNEQITYMPTAHEDTQHEHDFDVEIYNFSYNKSTYDKHDLHKILDKLQNQPVKMLNNVYKKMSYDKNISSFQFIEEKNKMQNHNIFLK